MVLLGYYDIICISTIGVIDITDVDIVIGIIDMDIMASWHH